MLAPIAIFVYNRPDHLLNLITDLQLCPEFEHSDVFVFCDGPKSDDDNEDVARTRAVVQDMLGDNASYMMSDVNKGLANSIIDGVSRLCDQFGQVIVLEDDLRVSSKFLWFLNAGLNEYRNDSNVFQISGHMFHVPEFADRDSALMLPFSTSWGWATWSRAWCHFDAQAVGSEIIASDKRLRRKFNIDGRYDYATMLENFKKGRNSSWAIRWYWSIFQQDGLVLFPPRTLVINQGFDGTGTHGRGVVRKFYSFQKLEDISSLKMPERFIEADVVQHVGQAVHHINGGRIGRLVDIFKRFVIKLV